MCTSSFASAPRTHKEGEMPATASCGGRQGDWRRRELRIQRGDQASFQAFR